MSAFSNAFGTHVRGETTTLCRCWIITLANGERMGFTDHDEDIAVSGVLCHRHAGAESSAIEETTGLNSDIGEISGALQSEHIREEDIRKGKFDRARIATYLVNWSEPEQFTLDRIQLVGRIVEEDGRFRFELRSLASEFDKSKGRHFIFRCQANLGDSRCTLDTGSRKYRTTGSVIRVNTFQNFLVSGLTNYDQGWFAYGHMEWITGHNAGVRSQIMSQTNSDNAIMLSLWHHPPEFVESGDEFVAVAGCDKEFKTCREKFTNAINFQGFPHMPGDRYALTTAKSDDTFDGGPVVS